MTAKDKTVTKIESSYMKKYDAHIDRERRKKRRLMRRLVFFSIIAVLMFGGLATYHVKQRMIYSEKQEQYEQLQAKQKKLKQTEKDLTEEIELLKDEDYVLEIARTNYFFSKKGEMIFKIPDKDPNY